MARRAATLLAALLAGCGGAGGDVADEQPARSADTPLVELKVTGPRPGTGSALRVTADGRYEHRLAGGDWKLAFTYSAAELQRVRRAVAEAAATAEDRYGEGEGVADGGTAVWRLLVDGRVHETVVEGHPIVRPAPFVTLLRRLSELHPPAKEASRWRLWSGGRLVELDVRCDARADARLAPVAEAVFDTAALPRGDTRPEPLPPRQTPLVDVAFLDSASGEAIDRTRVYGDGRVVEVGRDGGEQSVERLQAERLDALREALAATDWAALPGPIC